MNEKEPPAFYRIPIDMEAEMKRIERKELIKAARMLKEHCAGIQKNCYRIKVDCPFQRKYMKGLTYYCEFRNDTAQWYLPEVQDND